MALGNCIQDDIARIVQQFLFFPSWFGFGQPLPFTPLWFVFFVIQQLVFSPFWYSYAYRVRYQAALGLG